MEERSDDTVDVSSDKEGATLNDILAHLKEQKRELRTYLDSRLSVLENTQDVSKQMQKLKEEKDTIWKRDGNKEQYKFNSEVLEEVQQVLWAVKAGKFEYSGELLEALSTKLKKRNKLIRIADSSEAGWGAVKEYVANPLASDSDDDRKIARADSKAVKRLKDKKKKLKDSRRNRSSYGGPSFASGSARQDSYSAPSVVGDKQLFRPQQNGARGCFTCGEFGHFRRECPKTRTGNQ
ncbi:uncharacterized protein [Argopecten irradians]|uniref:uncharacterized protein n=1 Tax=Argopecten irradians TaxID=31199 RepID=UPI00371157D0